MRLHFYPPEDTMLPETPLDFFQKSAAWQRCVTYGSQPVYLRSRTGGEMPRPEYWNETVGLLNPQTMYKVSDVYFFPHFGVLISEDGGVFHAPSAEAIGSSRNCEALPYCTREGDGFAFYPPEGLPHLDTVAVTAPVGGGFGANYGHTILETLPASCLLKRYGILEEAINAVPPLKPWQLRHFELANLNPTVLPEFLYKVRSAIYTSGMDHNLHRPHFNYLDVRSAQLSNIRPNIKDTPERIYLYRGNGSSRINKSEIDLQRRLGENGFVTVDPSEMEVDDQIAMFSKCKLIVGYTGAAFANCLYANQEATVIEVLPSGMQYPWVQSLCGIIGCKHAAYFVQANVTDLNGHPHLGLEFDLDCDHFMDFVLL